MFLYICPVEKVKRHIAIFLLAVFSIAMAPPSLWHKAFANKDLGTHIESSHTSCDIFKTNTPVYDALKVLNTLSTFRVVISQYKIDEVSSTSYTTKISLPARAPPIA